MKVQIIVDGQVVDTQVVSVEMMGAKPSIMDAKKLALKASLEDRRITIGDSLRSGFRFFDDDGKPFDG